MKQILRLAAGLLLLGRVASAAETAGTNGITFTFLEPVIVPAWGLPEETRRAGMTPIPEATNSRPSGIQFGAILDPEDHGALSNLVAGHIARITVTWADTNLFKAHRDTESALRRLLNSPSSSTYTYKPWAQVLGLPSVAARVEHIAGKQGQLLLFGTGDYLFAYQDRVGKWWFGQWKATRETR